jgi:cytosine/uracil/thiamine/allantoin permease
VPALAPLYGYGWFVGFGVAFAAHFVLTKLSPPRVAGPEVSRELVQESPGD